MDALFGVKITTQSIAYSNFKKKALRTLFYKDHNADSNPLFLESGNIKLPDIVKIENCLLISKYVHNTLPSSFYSWFTFSSVSHRYETSFSS